MEKSVVEAIKEHNDVIGGMLSDKKCLESIAELSRMAIETYQNGKKLLLCGNGGSAADAQHIAAELVGRFVMERRALGAVALTVNSSSLTAIANDYGYNRVFARQVEAFGESGDLLIGISTSGNSPNVVKAMEKAKETGLKTAALTGDHGKMEILNHADVSVCVPSKITARIQEMHILIGHIFCEQVETKLFGG